MKKFIVISFLLVFVLGCQDNEKKIIPPRDMKPILVEMHIFDGMIAHSAYREKLDSIDTLSYEEAILNQYGYTKAQFDSSINYYSGRLRDFDKIYQEVLNELNRMQAETQEESKKTSEKEDKGETGKQKEKKGALKR